MSRPITAALLAAATSAFLGYSPNAAAQDTPLSGNCIGAIEYDSLRVPFAGAWRQRAGALALVLFNGDDSVSSTSVTVKGDSVVVDFAHMAALLRGTLKDGVLTGTYGNPRKREAFPVTLRPGALVHPAAAGAPNIDGTWWIPNESSKGERAWRFVVQQGPEATTATILRVDGDAGALRGGWDGSRFLLSHFDGARPARLDITPNDDGTLALVLRTPRGTSTLTALRPELSRARGLAEPSDFGTHTRVRDAREPFRFGFPDVDGNFVSSDDARFTGKVCS